MKITINTNVKAPISVVWEAWTSPKHIINWNFASEEWCCPSAENKLVEGGSFRYRMEAKDGSMGFDFDGKFTEIKSMELIQFDLGDGRPVNVNFAESEDGVEVTETFEAENEHSAEQQKAGWQSILNNFKDYVERNGS